MRIAVRTSHAGDTGLGKKALRNFMEVECIEGPIIPVLHTGLALK